MDIESVRDGLFLNKTGHSTFGLDIAILIVSAVHLKFSQFNNVYGQTTNFAMGSDDINIELDTTKTRFQAHLFDASYPRLLPAGPVVHVPNDLADWPPAVLFDAIYASAVVHHFNAFTQGFLDGWETKFYPRGLTTTALALADDQRRHGQAAVEKDNAK